MTAGREVLAAGQACLVMPVRGLACGAIVRRERPCATSLCCSPLCCWEPLRWWSRTWLREVRPQPFDDARLEIELNSTDGDAGLQIFADSDNEWKRFEIFRPGGEKILDISASGVLRDFGLSELFSESSEPPFTELPFAGVQEPVSAGTASRARPPTATSWHRPCGSRTRSSRTGVRPTDRRRNATGRRRGDPVAAGQRRSTTRSSSRRTATNPG